MKFNLLQRILVVLLLLQIAIFTIGSYVLSRDTTEIQQPSGESILDSDATSPTS